jgi:TonB family protein
MELFFRSGFYPIGQGIIQYRTEDMRCTDVHAHLNLSLRGEVNSIVGKEITSHLTGCRYCRLDCELLLKLNSDCIHISQENLSYHLWQNIRVLLYGKMGAAIVAAPVAVPVFTQMEYDRPYMGAGIKCAIYVWVFTLLASLTYYHQAGYRIWGNDGGGREYEKVIYLTSANYAGFLKMPYSVNYSWYNSTGNRQKPVQLNSKERPRFVSRQPVVKTVAKKEKIDKPAIPGRLVAPGRLEFGELETKRFESSAKLALNRPSTSTPKLRDQGNGLGSGNKPGIQQVGKFNNTNPYQFQMHDREEGTALLPTIGIAKGIDEEDDGDEDEDDDDGPVSYFFWPPAFSGNQQVNIVYPRIVAEGSPQYTEEARNKNITGSVLLTVTFNRDATISIVKIERGLGYGLDEAAIRAIKLFKFVPGYIDGKVADFAGKIEIRFGY